MSTTGPSVLTVTLQVSGQSPVTFSELVEARSLITNPAGVLAGRAPKALGVVTLANATSQESELGWLSIWKQAGATDRMDFTVVVADVTTNKTVAECKATAGFPTKLVFASETTGGTTFQRLSQLTLRCRTLKVTYD